MPRLINDLLRLSKEQKMLTLDTKETQNTHRTSYRPVFKGFGIGIFFSLLVFGEMIYLNGIAHEKLAVIAFGTALFGGFIAIMNKRS